MFVFCNIFFLAYKLIFSGKNAYNKKYYFGTICDKKAAAFSNPIPKNFEKIIKLLSDFMSLPH